MKQNEAPHSGSGWIGLETLGDLLDQASPSTTFRAARRAFLRPQTVLHEGRFEILEVLGSGGEGVVYRAYDQVRQKEIALKLLHLEEDVSRIQLKREFRCLRNLIHPHLVHLHELIVEPDLSFFTMTLIEGRGFLEAARDHDLLRRLLVQLAEVLEFLHGAGRLHRDIKPSNLLVQQDDNLVLVDFGVALDLTTHFDDASGIVGTPRYLAPEVIRGKDATKKSDAYSVGVLLYEALTGKLPHNSAIDGHSPKPPSTWIPDLPGDLEEICMALLEQDPDKRAGVDLLRERFDAESWSTPSSDPSLHHHREDRFTGRERELLRLETAHKQLMREKEAVIAVIEGRSGIGKSAFLDRFSAFHQDALILRGQCSEHEFVPHQALDGILEHLASALLESSTDELRELFPEEDANSLVPLFPELRRVGYIDRLVPMPSENVDVLRSLAHEAYAALGRVLRRIAKERTVFVIIDDLQWGDEDSARLLLDLLNEPEPPPCLFLFAYRSEEAHTSSCLRTLFGGNQNPMDRLRSLRLQLGPLDAREAQTLLDRWTRDSDLPPPIAEEVLLEAKGSPLLVTELVTHLKAERGQLTGQSAFSLSDVVAERVRSLDEADQMAFSLLCCAGTPLDVQILSELTGRDSDALSLHLETKRLARSREGGRKLQTLHDAIREAWLHALGDEAAPLHRLLADALTERDAEPARIALHYEQSGDLRQASSWAELAASRASQSLALAQAAELYRLALRGEPEGTARHHDLKKLFAHALADAGYGSEAAPLFAALAEKASPEEALTFRQKAAAQWLSSGVIERGWNEIVQAQNLTGLSWPHSIEAAVAQILLHRTAIRLKEKSFRVSPGAKLGREDKLRLSACRAAWSIAYMSSTHGAANSARFLHLALKSQDPEHIAIGFGMESLFRSTEGTPKRAIVERYREHAERLMPTPRTNYHAGFLHYVYGQSSYLLGDIRESIEPYELAEQELRKCPDVAWELSSSRTFWGSALIYLGRHRELDRRLTEWIRDARDRDDLYGLIAFEVYKLRRHALREGDHDMVLREAKKLVETWRSPHVGVHYSLSRLTRGHTAICMGRPDLAIEEMAELGRGIRRSLLSRVQLVRVAHGQIASVALVAEALRQRGTQRERLLVQAERLAARLLKENVAFGTAFARHIQANIAWIQRPDERSLALLEQARSLYEQLGFELNVAALDHQLGSIRRGEAGLALQRRAERVFAHADCDPQTGAMRCFAPDLTAL